MLYTDDRTKIKTHGFAAQSFRFKGGLLNHIVAFYLSKSLQIKQLLCTKIHDLMLNCLPVVTYMILCGFISHIKQKL